MNAKDKAVLRMAARCTRIYCPFNTAGLCEEPARYKQDRQAVCHSESPDKLIKRLHPLGT